MVIVLKGERPITWNKFYAGKHWGVRRTLADEIHLRVQYAVLEQFPGVTPFERRVHITMRAYFDMRPLDCCNLPAKLYIDGLHGRVITDDSPKYVASVTTESLVDKENPRVEIEIKEIE